MSQLQELPWVENKSSRNISRNLNSHYPLDTHGKIESQLIITPARVYMSTLAQSHHSRMYNVVKPHEYAQKVRDHSQTSISNSLYSGQRYESLAQFLWEPYQFASGRISLNRSKSEQAEGFATFCEFNDDIPPILAPLKWPLSQGQNGNTPPRNCLLFLRGYPSATWLNELGARYKIDPEFFHRHLSFLSNDQHNFRPTPFVLPSSQSTIFQLTVTSIGVQESRRHTSTHLDRIDLTKKMEAYLHSLKIGQGWRCRESVVRSFNTHSEKEFSIEQAVTVYVASTDKETERWLGIWAFYPLL